MDAESMFAGMAKAPMFGAGQYFGEGEFLVETKSIKMNNGHKGLCFIVEFKVLESNSEKDPVGSIRSWVVKMGAGNLNAFSDIKGFLFALALGIDPKKAGTPEENPDLHSQATEFVKAACDPNYAQKIGADADALIGLPVKLYTFQKPTKPSLQKPQGGLFTVHNYSPAAAA